MVLSVSLSGCNLGGESEITSESYATVCCYGAGFATRYFGGEDERDNFGSACSGSGSNFVRSECDSLGSMNGHCEAPDIYKYYWETHFNESNAKVNCSVIPNSKWVN